MRKSVTPCTHTLCGLFLTCLSICNSYHSRIMFVSGQVLYSEEQKSIKNILFPLFFCFITAFPKIPEPNILSLVSWLILRPPSALPKFRKVHRNSLFTTINKLTDPKNHFLCLPDFVRENQKASKMSAIR